jgi:hypothetical protein
LEALFSKSFYFVIHFDVRENLKELVLYDYLFSTFCFETKSGAKNSRQIQMLRWICRANAQARFIQLRRFILIVCQALHVCYTAGAVIAPLMITIFT